jgi:hypothetical protein
MKSILVGKIEDSRLYYVADSIDESNDGVIVNSVGDVRLVNFWDCVDNGDVHKIQNTDFHDYLWNGHKSAKSGHWYSTFVIKSIPVAEELLGGVVINYDVLRRKSKLLDYENRAIDYKAAMSSQTISEKILNRLVDSTKSISRTCGKRNSE